MTTQPESPKLRQAHMVKVQTFQLGLEQPIRERLINFHRHNDRVWLLRHMTWALHANHEVLCFSAD